MSTGLLIVIILCGMLVFGGFSGFVASQKNRNIWIWFFLGFLFSWIALLALAAVPPLPKRAA